jgi:hypothetical protein
MYDILAQEYAAQCTSPIRYGDGNLSKEYNWLQPVFFFLLAVACELFSFVPF